MSRQGLYIVLALLLNACRVPKDTLLFSTSDLGIPRKTRTIPSEWDNRYLAMGATFEVGGDSVHRHVIQHVHLDTSSSSLQNVNPLGLALPTSSSQHTHVIYSYFQNPYYSGYSEYTLHTAELRASITLKGFNKLPTGLIVPYLGSDIPKGWIVCDGSNNTPNLSGVYIKLKQNTPALTPYGSNSHIHSTNHSHKWGVNPPDGNNNVSKALAKDELAYDSDTIGINVFDHIHGIEEAPLVDTETETKEILPPSLSIIFIQATDNAKKLPKGTILPYLGSNKILGWRFWDVFSKQETVFAFGFSAEHPLLSRFGNPFHYHTFEHTHHLILTSVPHKIISVSQNEAPLVAQSIHTHTVDAHLIVQTDSSSSLPLFVRIPFIIKK